MINVQQPIGIIRAEGVGPEIAQAALICLNAIQKRFGISFRFVEYKGKAPATSFSEQAYQELKTFYEEIRAQSGCVLRAAIYARTVFQLRKDFQLTVKPIYFSPIPELESESLLKSTTKKVDILLIRQNTNDFLWDKEKIEGALEQRIFSGLLTYFEDEIIEFVRFGFEQANTRKKKIFLFLKGDVEGGLNKLWLEVFHTIAKDYPKVLWDWDHPDGGFASLLKNPDRFDVIMAQNKEGDLIADPLGALLYGSYAIVPSANINPRSGFMTFQTVHGTAHEIAGQNKANPVGMIRSTALMLKLFFHHEQAADAITMAVRTVLGQKYRTIDMFRPELGHQLIGTKEIGEKIAEAILST